eukprot:CAMPEP_0181121218 /NCGR_PEP_ID=MMETSP1071-20121207/24613_1 /TAXON_ID=35127 /ORGANISM="Thalassiosira sp., Strain NH16" /LENGTH=179 /DNA_ID=CAMNT_0023206007 /DNA_START=45 /DNA_END=582 /DNA_ORIENTATION=+
MAIIDDDDEFFGDQASHSESPTSSLKDIGEVTTTSSDPFGNVADHEYRSRGASIKTLSYLDGYDETKEEKLQHGFSRGYQQSFDDAYSVGRRLGSLCARAALNESETLGLPQNKSTTPEDLEERCSTAEGIIIVERSATLVRQFLTDEILIDSKGHNAQTRYDEAILKLKDQLGKIFNM